MPTTAFTIENVPEDVARRVEARAAAAGQSLQEYLLALVIREASRPTNAELAERMKRQASVDLSGVDVRGGGG
ncbi:antitoxin [Streptomyces sp. OF3]|uniref:Antitoxin n=1 Tax=Streptomyces alkaliterrae TaxID=2213162 RepID=A0A5P0YLW5_9ACTN|nr:antitoxin [Streptomyces alkaliterrae]MBB1262417.1 antitoxin [Streptomyces alkaliterrae]MQS00627.1 antitoxin [Streptomyces alkaliterrae]